MNKIRRYFSTLEITRGFFIALLGSLFIYLEYWELSEPFLNTLFALLSLYLLLQSNQKTWFFAGFFTGIFWFWWITVSFQHYNMLWAIPIVLFFIAFTYALLFGFIAWIGDKVNALLSPHSSLLTLAVKAIGLLLLSYIHPFGFDWFKPELIFVNSYLGIEKWQFALVLTAMTLSIWKKQFAFMLLVLLAYQPAQKITTAIPNDIQIITTQTSVEDKWDTTMHNAQFKAIFQKIDRAIQEEKTLIIFPESIFPVFINYDKALLEKLKKRSQNISLVLGGLYWDGKTPYNSTYIFTEGKMQIANKVLLVPFGESNPLPDFLSDWVNKVFYDGAVDYKADENVTDYVIDGITYRNAICFEATSEKLYAKNAKEKRPENMIVLSNNGWFTPSTEPTLQRLLLQYYSQKYGTTIYHSVNMSESYVVTEGKMKSSLLNDGDI